MIKELVTSYAPLVWFAIGALTITGLVAVVSPRRFTGMSQCGSEWVDTNKLFAFLDKRVDVDQYVLPCCRWLGVAVLGSAAILIVLVTRV